MAWKANAPDYAKPYIEKGMFVRIHDNDTCYLYRKTSRRIPGRKYPIPVEKYLGKITRQDGLIPCDFRKIDITEIEVEEYGWSRAMQQLTPESWKRAAGSEWELLLSVILIDASPRSFLRSEIPLPIPTEVSARVKTQKVSLFRRLREERRIVADDLEPLKDIFLLKSGKGQKMLSKISESHRALIDKLNIQIALEVC